MERERFPRAGARHLRSRAAPGKRPAGTMTGLRGNPLHWDGRGRVTPAPIEFRPRKRVLELSCGVRSLQQVPWWDADRRARDASRAAVPAGTASLRQCACRRSASFCLLGMIEPKAGPTAGLGVTRSCSEGVLCGWYQHNSGAHASRERNCVALTPRRRGSPPPCGEGLGVGVER